MPDTMHETTGASGFYIEDALSLDGRSPFWRHFHWGLFEDPESVDDPAELYLGAAEAMTERIVTAGEVADGSRVLDVGCGFGGTLDHVRNRNQGCRLAGVNIDWRQLRRGRELLTEHSEGGPVPFVTADGCSLPVADGSVDHVLAVECIFHFPSRKTFFREAARVLRPGGTLALSDFVLAPGGLKAILSQQDLTRPPGDRDVDPTGEADAQRKAANSNVLTGTVDDGWYGRFSRPLSSTGYAKLGRSVGLDVLVDEDVTARTLPTYPALRSFYWEGKKRKALLDEKQSEDGLNSIDHLDRLAAEGVFQYHVMSYRRKGL